jgi:hypothetical protein
MELEKQRKTKGKKVINLFNKVKKPLIKKETNEFLKLMKHNEYNFIKQLKKPTKISLLSLILSFKPHRKAL